MSMFGITLPPDGQRPPGPTLAGPEQRIYLALVILWFVLTLAGLGSAPLFDWDEAAHAQAAAEMLRDGTWLLPTANGQQFFEKPAFLFYFMSASFALFGRNAFAARLPSALFTLATALFLLHAGRRIKEPRTGAAASLIFLSMLMPSLLAHTAILDATLNFWTTVSIVAFFLWRQGGRTADAVLSALAAGIAVSVKGPVGAALPVMVVVLDRLIAKDLVVSLRKFPWGRGTLVFLAGALPWYALVTLVYGAGFLKQFLLVENLSRFAKPMEGHSGGWYYYLLVLAPCALPWTAWLPWWTAKAVSQRKEEGTAVALSRLGLVWTASVMVLFSLSGTKLPHYISGIYPGVALGLAAHWLKEEPGRAWTRSAAVILFILCLPLALALIGLPYLVSKIAAASAHTRAATVLSQGVPPGLGVPAAGTIIAVALIILVLLVRRMQPSRRFVLFVLFGMLLQSALVWSLAPWAGRLLEGNKLALAERVRTFPGTKPLYSLVNAPSLSFYSGRSYTIVTSDDVRERLQAASEPVLLIARPEHLAVIGSLPLDVVERQGDLTLYEMQAHGRPHQLP